MTIEGEGGAYASQLRWVLERLASTLEEVPPDALDERLYEGGSSPAMIAAHVEGAARAWVLGIGCGLPAERERPAEFATSGVAAAALAAALRALADEADGALAELDPARLGERVVPPKALYGEGEPTEVVRREAIVSAIKHAGQHLGELSLIRDLLAEGRRS